MRSFCLTAGLLLLCCGVQVQTQSTDVDTTATAEVTSQMTSEATEITQPITSEAKTEVTQPITSEGTSKVSLPMTSTSSGSATAKCACPNEETAWLITIIVGSIAAFLLVVVIILLSVIMCRKNMFVPDKLLIPINMQTVEPTNYSQKQVGLPIGSQAHSVATIAASRPQSYNQPITASRL